MVVITGRPAKEIAPLLRGYPPVVDPMLEVWGLHGAERLYPDGRRELEEAPPETQRSWTSCASICATTILAGNLRTSPMPR